MDEQRYVTAFENCLSDESAPITELAAIAIDFTEHTVGLHSQDIIAGRHMANIKCERGCHYCCHNPVGVTPPEIFHIVDYILAFEYLAERVDEIIAAALRAERLTAAERIKARIPCPLLAHGECIVYAVRPLACRGTNSADVASCKIALLTGNPRYPVRSYVPQKSIFEQGRRCLANVLNRNGFRDALIELSGGLRHALSDPDARQRWESGGNFVG